MSDFKFNFFFALVALSGQQIRGFNGRNSISLKSFEINECHYSFFLVGKSRLFLWEMREYLPEILTQLIDNIAINSPENPIQYFPQFLSKTRKL
jgi:hypothetical protein